MTISDYLTALERALKEAKVPARQRRVVLIENRSLLAELTNLETELGSPEDYAAMIVAELDSDCAESSEPQWVFAGIPVDFSGLFRLGSYQRIFDPADSRIFLPHLCGAGWTVNLGAVAVKCGLIRPDDIDTDVLAAIPTGAKRVLASVPYVLTGVNALLIARHFRSLPAQVHVNWTLSGKPRGNPISKYSLIPLLALSGCATLVSSRNDLEPIRVGISTAMASGVLGQTCAIIRSAQGGSQPGLAVPAGVIGGTAVAVAMIVVPIRAGLRRIWREQGVYEK